MRWRSQEVAEWSHSREKRLRSPKITTRDEDPPTDRGMGLDGTMILGLWCEPHDHLLQENSGQVIRVPADLSNEETSWITTVIDIKTTERDHSISQTKTNPRSGEVTITIHDRLQPHDESPHWQSSADNPDQIRLTLQCLTGLESETRATIYNTIRSSQLTKTETSQTWFDSLQQAMKLKNYRDNAL